METIRIHNRYSKELEKPCFYAILTKEHNIKENDLINIQLVCPIKNFTYKKVKVLDIRKILVEDIWNFEPYNAIEEMEYWLVRKLYEPKDELIKLFLQNIKEQNDGK